MKLMTYILFSVLASCALAQFQALPAAQVQGRGDVLNGLVAWWRADGDTSDSSGRGNAGLWNSGEAYTNGARGQAFATTTTTYLYSTNRAAFYNPGGYTVCMWVRPRLTGGEWFAGQWGAVGAGNASWGIGRDTSGNLRLLSYNGSSLSILTSTSKLEFGTYTHIAGVYTGGNSGVNAMIYTNGILAYSGTVSVVPQQSSNYDMRLGFTYGIAANQCANADFDSFRYYNRPLTAREVEIVHRNGN